MADVFISYAREDQAFARSLVGALKHAGYDVWWDEEILPVDDFRPQIDSELSGAKAVVVIWSSHSKKSCFVCDEASRALKQGKLISTRLENFDELPPVGFGERQVVPVTDYASIFKALDKLDILKISSKPKQEQQRIQSEAEIWNRITSSHSADDIIEYLKLFPDGPRALHVRYLLNLATCTILMASTSPRRKALLEQIGWQEDKDFLMEQVPHQSPHFR